MSAGYDGSIRIDTRVDSKGFNQGLSKISASIKSVFTNIALGATRMAVGFTGAIIVIQMIIRFLTQIMQAVYQAAGSVSGMSSEAGNLKSSMDNLKNAALSAFLPLIPIIQTIVNWLTKVINTVSMIIAALMGQKAIMVSTAAASGGAAGGAKKLAKNTKDAEKAAKGALAAFDEINVLQMEQPEEEAEPSGGGGGGGGFTMQPITEEIAGFIQKIKDFFAPFKEPLDKLKTALTELWDTGKKAMQPIWDWMGAEGQGLLEWLRELAIDGIEWLTLKIQDLTVWIENNQTAFQIIMLALLAIGVAILLINSPLAVFIAILAAIAIAAYAISSNWGTIKEFFINLWTTVSTFFVTVWTSVSTFFVNLWTTITDAVVFAWEFIKTIWQGVAAWFGGILDAVIAIFKPAWDYIGILVNNAWAVIKLVWGLVVDWFNAKIITPVKAIFTILWFTVQQIFSKAWDAIATYVTDKWATLTGLWEKFSSWFSEHVTDPIKEAFTTALNWVEEKWGIVFGALSGVAKGAINVVIDLINGFITKIVDAINGITGIANQAGMFIPGWLPIPKVVAPQIPRLATGAVIPPNSEFLAVLGDQRSGRNIEAPEGLIRQIIQEELGNIESEVTINFSGNLGALVRELRPYIEKENTRIGKSLLSGGVA